MSSEHRSAAEERSAMSSDLSLAGRSVLVTGGAGFIGSHLTDRLVAEAPANLVVVDNLFLGKERNLAAARQAFPGLRFYRQDTSDYDAMREILTVEETDVVFDLAVVPLPTSLERPRWTVDVNLAMTTVLCELLRERVFQTMVHFSSSEVYGTAQYEPMDEGHPLLPLTPYAASKAGGDHIVAAYRATFGVDVATVRPFNAYGPRQNEAAYAGVIPIVVRRALAGEEIEIHGDGEQTRDFTFVADMAEFAVRVHDTPTTRGRVLNVASGREVSVNTLVATLLDALGVDAPVVHTAPRPGDVRRHCGSPAAGRELTGFRPGTGLDEGLAQTVAWYRGLLAPAPASHRG
jgi:UDP-glucose 4-epimerase